MRGNRSRDLDGRLRDTRDDKFVGTLEAQYGLEIPVLMIEGKKAAKYRVAEEELRKLLAGRAGWAG